MAKEIVVAQRGWVFIGDVSISDNEITIQNAKNIRRWGTTGGLGQLAAEGPQEGTKLDEYGTVSLHPLAVIARIKVTSDKWQQQ
ncbi:MAG: hypothetical protein EPGJADBJ_04450 [Saprospiraceae bacterium]|nr:hypothetical protein [Saprospiraceae bacterium]